MQFLYFIPLFLISIFTFLYVITLLFDIRNAYFGFAPALSSSKKAINTMFNCYKPDVSMKIADLGSGKGNILVKLAKNGYYIDGYDNNYIIYIYSLLKIKFLGFSTYVNIFYGNVLTKNLKDYNLFYIYGMGNMMIELEKKIVSECNKGTVVISNKFKFPNLIPIKRIDKIFIYEI